MEPVERLAALLDGELSADETAALRAEIARRGELADLLAALQRADTALDAVPSTPEPVGFEARLAARLAPEIAATVGRPTAADEPVPLAPVPLAPVPLAPAPPRPARGMPRWVPAFGGAAAGLLLLAGTAVVVLSGAGGDDDAVSTMLAEDREDAPVDRPTTDRTSPGADGPVVVTDGPVVVTDDRDLDAGSADALLAGPELQAVSDLDLDPASGRALASRWRDELDSSEALAAPDAAAEAAPEAAPDAAPEAAPDDASDAEVAEAPTIAGDGGNDTAPAGGEDGAESNDDGSAAAEPDAVALRRCLDVVLAADADAIPAYLEVARFEGQPSLIYGLVTIDPSTGAYTREEVWVVDRATCEPRRFAQGADR